MPRYSAERKASVLKKLLPPHNRLKTFKNSSDPAFADKVIDLVGLYMNPPENAVVLSVDEKTQIQALERTQPGLPLNPSWIGSRTPDYKRHGTTSLYAAFRKSDGESCPSLEQQRVFVIFEIVGATYEQGESAAHYFG